MVRKALAWAAGLLLLLVAVGVGLHITTQRSGPPLAPWHRFVPPELDARELDLASWPDYLRAERRAFDAVASGVSDALDVADRVSANRYFAGSPLHGARRTPDWNRSTLLEPTGAPVGAVVLLHGMTDAPYSLRHVAQHYQRRGFVALALRLPGHGTVPGALTEVQWQDWLAATRLALREARRRAGPERPLHLVGYSNGAALGLKAALDALEDPALPRPDRLVLISPMVGVTAMARFAGVLGWPALLPPFASAAWLGVLPEYNPFKYNSFPVNAARQSSLLTRALQSQLGRLAADGRLAALPPLLTFQSVVDYTVSTLAGQGQRVCDV
jgi:alpha-beta hydrolase superfamily lysophospholipase